MDDLDRLFVRLIDNVRSGYPEYLSRPFEIAELYQTLVPYRHNRRELGIDSNGDYEMALIRLLAGERGYLSGDAGMQEAIRSELKSSNPNTAIFREFAATRVAIAPDAVRRAEQLAEGADAPGALPYVEAPAASHAGGRGGPPAFERQPERPPIPAADVAPRAAPLPPPPTFGAGVPPGPPPMEARGPAAVSAPPPAPPRPGSAERHGPGERSGAGERFGQGERLGPGERGGPAERTEPAVPNAPIEAAAPAAAGAGARPSAPQGVIGGSCRYCNGALPTSRRTVFCPHCGQNLTIQRCPACGTELELGWKFCIACGRGVTQA